VPGEAITYLYDAIGPAQAQSFINSVLAAVDAATYELVHISPKQFRRAWQMRQRYQDKPDISFVDFTSMIAMQELGITDVFTGDAHFQQVNLGFRLLP
jgi:predicted nucleic acid-binding protein